MKKRDGAAEIVKSYGNQSVKTEGGKVVGEACRRFPQVSDRALARYILNAHGPLFCGDYERVRNAVRYARGHAGIYNKRHSENNNSLVPCARVAPPSSMSVKRTPRMIADGNWLVMADVHVPWHEQKPIDAALNYAHKSGLDRLLILGDLQHSDALGRWSATRFLDFVGEEVPAVIDFLDWLRGMAWKEIVWLPGNHDLRLYSYYRMFAPQLADLPQADIGEVLALEHRGIELLAPFQTIKVGEHLALLHGHELGGMSIAVNPARGLFLKAGECAACGHWHQSSQHNGQSFSRTMVSTWSLGCLCDLSPDYRPHNQWNWGFAELRVNPERGGVQSSFELHNRRILNTGKVV